MSQDAAYWIRTLGLTSHTEGGSYREVYRSSFAIPLSLLPEGFNGDRPLSTSIFYLLELGQYSAFHRLASDELWHFYQGDPLTIYECRQGQGLIRHLLGPDPENGEQFQVCIPAGHWFAARLEGGNYVLAGCTVAPGFDPLELEMASRAELTEAFPEFHSLIASLTR
jgi:predicted cupin superfamily sugar epimerase